MTQVFYRAPAHHYPTIERGQGIYLWDSDSRRYLDGSSGALVVNIGHGRDEVVDAMAAQARRVAFAHTMRFTSAAQERLAELLAQHLSDWDDPHTYFVSGGSEAMETAIKMARQYHLERGEHGRYKVLSRWASYHGNTLGALAASGHIGRRRPYDPLVNGSAFVHFNPCLHASFPACGCLAALEGLIEQAGPDTLSMLVIEVVGGSSLSGYTPPAGYLAQVAELCGRYGLLMAVDEVMTGMGRTGEWWAHSREGFRPDLMVLAKGLASGYSPLGAVVAQAPVWQAIRQGSGRFAHGLTFGGNPVSAAAGVAVMELMDHEDLVPNARRRGEQLAQQLERLAAVHPLILTVRGRGLMQGLVLQSVDRKPGATASGLADDAFSHGLIIYPGSGGPNSLHGDHVLVAPPLCIGSAQVGELIQLLDQALTRTEKRYGLG